MNKILEKYDSEFTHMYKINKDAPSYNYPPYMEIER